MFAIPGRDDGEEAPPRDGEEQERPREVTGTYARVRGLRQRLGATYEVQCKHSCTCGCATSGSGAGTEP